MSSLHLPVPAVRRLAVALLLMVSVGPPALAGEVEVREAEDFEAQLAAPDPRLLERVAALREAEPETGIRDLYENYERIAEQSGHDLDLRLSSFETIGIDEFSRYRWLDLMTLSTGMHVELVQNYYDAPWLDGDHVYYELLWQPRHANSEAIAQSYLEEYRGVTIAEVVLELTQQGQMTAPPIAVTTYRVDVSLAGRSRTYRAVALWFDGEDGDFRSQIEDRVVDQVASVVDETATVITKEEYDNLGNTAFRAVATGGLPPPKPCDP